MATRGDNHDNPYPEERFTRCPQCRAKMRQRKVPLVIHLDQLNPVALNQMCRSCLGCDLLMAHQDDRAGFGAAFFAEDTPAVMGHDCLAIGTLDRPDWHRGSHSPLPIREMVERRHDFRDVLWFELVGAWGAWQRG